MQRHRYSSTYGSLMESVMALRFFFGGGGLSSRAKGEIATFVNSGPACAAGWQTVCSFPESFTKQFTRRHRSVARCSLRLAPSRVPSLRGRMHTLKAL